MARVVVATDGYVSAAGEAGWAFVAEAVDAPDLGELAAQRGRLATCPSHLAEWFALARALAWAEEALAPGDTLELRTDSALVAKGLASRRPAMGGEAAVLRAACRQALARLAQRGVRAKVLRVAREQNARADADAREAALTGSTPDAGAP